MDQQENNNISTLIRSQRSPFLPVPTDQRSPSFQEEPPLDRFLSARTSCRKAGIAMETVLGRVLLLQLIAELVRGYRDNETWSLQLLNSTRIHILPTLNPDGFDEADTNCLLSQGRLNHNGVDLNRGFPDAFAGLRKQQDLNEEQREAENGPVLIRNWVQLSGESSRQAE
ncbi:hypothetical protein CCH79_00017782 [Gambusia affinis]|uniref:Peptidase M14 domain-containing protein n=1 Tax=Gambusia affinis TaxID=33528 RepID=A0A315VG58_GAMAF|nr:hypothetical protein CCH79_00017782 [Gambusia affinis]